MFTMSDDIDSTFLNRQPGALRPSRVWRQRPSNISAPRVQDAVDRSPSLLRLDVQPPGDIQEAFHPAARTDLKQRTSGHAFANEWSHPPVLLVTTHSR